MKTVTIVGAGQLGSRHLQALQAVETPLAIEVIDPSPTSLQVARERFEAVAKHDKHTIRYEQTFTGNAPVDIAIVATNADTRRVAVEGMLARGDVRALVLEKLLFTERGDYAAVAAKLTDKAVPTWVNCPMRVMPCYEEIRAELGGGPLHYRVTGSKFGLVTNAIHYIDHAAHLSGCDSFTLDVSGLSKDIIASKRAGFLELDGTLLAHFADGSRCEVVCHENGDAPVLVEIFNEQRRYIVMESAGRMLHASTGDGWVWHERPAVVPFQSQITANVVNNLLAGNACGLTSFDSSVKLHLALLDPLLKLVQSSRPATNHYPFT